MIKFNKKRLVTIITRQTAIFLFNMISFFVFITKGNKSLINIKLAIGLFVLSVNSIISNAQVKTIENKTDTFTIDVTLEPEDRIIDEVVVMCYYGGHIRTRYFEYTGGPKELELFIQKNLKLPVIVTEKNINDSVKVELILNDYGNIMDFKIIKSINKDCDNEALRLIKIMPRWQPEQGNRDIDRPRNPVITIPFNSKKSGN